MRNLISAVIVFFIVLCATAVSAELQILPTGMRLTVLSSLGNPVENAKVTIYKTWDDYENEENAVAGPAFTDGKGRVTFKNLEEKQYYVQAIKKDAEASPLSHPTKKKRPDDRLFWSNTLLFHLLASGYSNQSKQAGAEQPNSSMDRDQGTAARNIRQCHLPSVSPSHALKLLSVRS